MLKKIWIAQGSDENKDINVLPPGWVEEKNSPIIDEAPGPQMLQTENNAASSNQQEHSMYMANYESVSEIIHLMNVR